MKFSALNVDFSSLSLDRFMEPGAGGLKDFKDFGLRKSISFIRWRVGGVA